MLRTLLMISLIFGLSIIPSIAQLYATCGTCGVSEPGDSGGDSVGDGGAADAALFGLMFSAMMAARDQEEVKIDLDALAMEYATAFNVMDPTAGIPHLAGVARGSTFILVSDDVSGGTGVATAKPGCSCSAVGNNCVCPEEFTCGGATHVVQWDGESGGVLSAEWVCGGKPGGGTGDVSTAVPPPEDTPGCSCGGVGCKCPKDLACGGATDIGVWDRESGRKISILLRCGGSGGGTGGVSTAVPPPEDTPGCLCGGGKCECVIRDQCKVQHYRDKLQEWSRRAMDVPRGSVAELLAAEAWEANMGRLKAAEKKCK